MKILRIFATIIAGLTASLALVFLASYFGLISGIRTYIVLSGSMEPAIRVGSLVMVAPQKTYLENEIISYSPDGSKENVITHRIISKQYPKGVHQPAVYLTAGDANPYFDQRPVKENQVLGKAVLALPYLGIWANFVKQPLGFILFVIVPATIIIWEELRNIQKESKKIYQKIKARQNQETNLGKEKRGLNQAVIALPIFAAALALTSLSLSVFSDREMSSANTFVAGEWAIPTLTPTPTSTPTPSNMLINELMWMGGYDHYDEWIELKNGSLDSVNVKGWNLTRWSQTSGAEELLLAIPSDQDYIIPPGGYFLIARRGAQEPDSNLNIDPDIIDSFNLHNQYLQIKLYDGDWELGATLIDTAGDRGTPLAGINGTGSDPDKSMERNDAPGDGTLTSNWHTATLSVNFDPGDIDLGTPKSANSPP